MAKVNMKIEFTEKHGREGVMWAGIDKSYEVSDKRAYHIYKKLQDFALRHAELKKVNVEETGQTDRKTQPVVD